MSDRDDRPDPADKAEGSGQSGSPDRLDHPDRGAPARTPAQIRAAGNRLRGEASLYLRQHAHNPLDWHPWGEEALALARAERRPIFLSIGYASCHWCHVMEREVFDRDDIAEFMNRHYVCIKVDREERPDLDAAYMDAVQGLGGRGGWPLSVFLTADAQPIYGGTYFPAEAFLTLARRVRDIYAERRGEIEEQAGAYAERLEAAARRAVAEAASGGDDEAGIDAALVAETARGIATVFDRRWGGLAGDVKFPVPPRWQFLLHHHRKTGDPEPARFLQLTLVAMASGGIYDHVGGGFHRYSVDEAWLVPHFEKMLYDNAQLASLYLEAGVVLGRPELTAVADDTLDFLQREMRAEEGGFHASLDADSGGEEGSFYVWNEQDLVAAAGAADGPVLAALLGVTAGGAFADRRGVPTRRADLEELAQRFGRPLDEIGRLFNRWRTALREFRDRRARPARDEKIVTAWNGLAIGAFARAYAVTGDPERRRAAERAADWLERAHRRPDGRLGRASTGGVVVGDGVLDDYALLACGLLDLYEATGEAARLARALELIEIARGDFGDPDGGFFLTAAGAEAPLGRRGEPFDSVTPSGAAALLNALLRAAAVTGRDDLRAEAARALRRHAGLMRRAGLEMAGWFDAALRLNGPFYEVVIAGDAGDPATRALAGAVRGLLPPQAVVVEVPAAGPDAALASLVPPAAGRTAAPGRAIAYVCERGACLDPASDPEALREQVIAGWSC